MRIIKKKKKIDVPAAIPRGCNNWNDDKVKAKRSTPNFGVWTGTWIPNKLLL